MWSSRNNYMAPGCKNVEAQAHAWLHDVRMLWLTFVHGSMMLWLRLVHDSRMLWLRLVRGSRMSEYCGSDWYMTPECQHVGTQTDGELKRIVDSKRQWRDMTRWFQRQTWGWLTNWSLLVKLMLLPNTIQIFLQAAVRVLALIGWFVSLLEDWVQL